MINKNKKVNVVKMILNANGMNIWLHKEKKKKENIMKNQIEN